MKTLRILALTSLVAGFGLMTGCDSTSSTGDAPSISSPIYVSEVPSLKATDTLKVGTSWHLAGTVKNVSSWLWTIVNASTGKAVDTIVVAAPGGSGSTDIGGGTSSKLIQFTPTAKWGSTGTYSVKGVLTGTDGSVLTTSISFSAVTGGTTTPTGTAVSATTVTLGSNDNATYGSSIDADAMSVYKISQVTTALQGEIDAYYAYSSADKSDKFFSPSQAKTSGFDGIKNWTVSTSVALYNLGTMTATAFAAITTQEQINALFTGKTSAVSVPAAADVVVGIKTSAGVYRVLHVDAITAGSTGTVTVKGYK